MKRKKEKWKILYYAVDKIYMIDDSSKSISKTIHWESWDVYMRIEVEGL